MKAPVTTLVCVIALTLAGVAPSQARENQGQRNQPQPQPSVVVKAADAVVVRPISFAATVVGSSIFVLGLPVTALLKQTKAAAQAMVVHPFKATFTRPLGDMDAMAD
jgi:hypothetical protein